MSRRFNTGWEDGNYGLVAGHGESGETAREGTAREALEEAGIVVDPEALEYKLTQYRFARDKDNHHARVGFYFKANSWQGEIKNMEPNKCDDLGFFPIDDLPKNTVDHVREAIRCYKNGVNYSEFNWEEKND